MLGAILVATTAILAAVLACVLLGPLPPPDSGEQRDGR
jgi:hypothetical protein